MASRGQGGSRGVLGGASWQQGGCWGGGAGGQGAAGGALGGGHLGGGAGRGGTWRGVTCRGRGLGGRNYIIYYRFISNDKLLFFNVI